MNLPSKPPEVVIVTAPLPPAPAVPAAASVFPGANAILDALAGIKTDLRVLGETFDTHKRETEAKFDGVATTVGQIVEYVNGSLPPPAGMPPGDGSTPIVIEPLRVTVPRAAKVAEQARTEVAALALQLGEMRTELGKQSSLMGIGKKGIEWALSSEGRKQLAMLALMAYGVLHSVGIIK